jgi:hypothetical protein
MSASSTYVESDISVYCLASGLAETILFLLGKRDPLGTFLRCFFQWSSCFRFRKFVPDIAS